MVTYRIPFPDGTSATTEEQFPMSYAVVVQERPGDQWQTWDGYVDRLDAAGEATALLSDTPMHAAEVVSVAVT